ncbi:MAG: molybdenum cofactor guanylyltransferase [Chloroflexota bacterium]
MDTSSLVLAGGQGLRFGQNKILETVGKRSLLEQVVACVSSISKETIVVVAGERTVPNLSSLPVPRIVADILPGKGPMGGIYTGLMVSSNDYNLVVAGDMPFLNPRLLRYMIDQAPDYDVVIPRLDGGMVEPLHAVYARRCLSYIEKMLEEDNLSVHRLLTALKVRYLEAAEIDAFDPQHLSFFNVNTKADLARARQLTAENNYDKR